MAINFDSLPKDKPFSITPAGRYFATIDSAEMKQGKDTTKPPYLNLKYKLKTKEGKNAGVIFDIIAESDKPLMQYKLKRFLQAIEVDFEGAFELKDLQKLCVGKEFIVDTTIEEGKDGRQDRATVDVIKGEIYYKIDEADGVFEGAVHTINADDAEDSKPADKTVDQVIDEF